MRQYLGIQGKNCGVSACHRQLVGLSLAGLAVICVLSCTFRAVVVSLSRMLQRSVTTVRLIPKASFCPPSSAAFQGPAPPSTFLVEGGAETDRRIHNRAGLQRQPPFLQELANRSKDAFAELMPLKQIPGRPGSSTRQEPASSVSSTPAKRRIDSESSSAFSHRSVRKAKPVLHEADTQHPFQRYRMTAIAGLWGNAARSAQSASFKGSPHPSPQKTLPTGHLVVSPLACCCQFQR